MPRFPIDVSPVTQALDDAGTAQHSAYRRLWDLQSLKRGEFPLLLRLAHSEGLLPELLQGFSSLATQEGKQFRLLDLKIEEAIAALENPPTVSPLSDRHDPPAASVLNLLKSWFRRRSQYLLHGFS